jgi:RNA polymerase sigma-70 factor (ECF subfamily)
VQKSNTDNDTGVQEYIRRTLQGNTRSFEWIIRKFQKRLYYSVLQIAGTHEDADDILQDTFIKAYRKLDTYDDQYPFYPWLYRIAINTALNHQKRKARNRAISLDDIESNGHYDVQLSEGPQQMFDMVGGELIEGLKLALEKIPVEQKTVFMLRVHDGLSYQEISETLQISMGTVMSRLSRARDKLRALLKSYIETKDVEVD